MCIGLCFGVDDVKRPFFALALKHRTGRRGWPARLGQHTQQGAISKRNSVSFPDCVRLRRDENEVCGNVEKVLGRELVLYS